MKDHYVVIHCPTDAQQRKEGVFGTTWVLSYSPDSRKVVVRHSTCSPSDQYSKRKGVILAVVTAPVNILKKDLIFHTHTCHSSNGKYNLPTTEQLFYAVLKLSNQAILALENDQFFQEYIKFLENSQEPEFVKRLKESLSVFIEGTIGAEEYKQYLDY